MSALTQGVPSRRSPSQPAVRLQGHPSKSRGKQTTELSSRTFSINIVVLEVQIIKPDIVALHLGGTIQRTFTKDYVQRLLGGHPDCL